MRRYTVVLVPAVLLASWAGAASAQSGRAPSVSEAVRRVPSHPNAGTGVIVRGASTSRDRSCRDGYGYETQRGSRRPYGTGESYDRYGRYDGKDPFKNESHQDAYGRGYPPGQRDARAGGQGSIAVAGATADADRAHECGYNQRSRTSYERNYDRYDDRRDEKYRGNDRDRKNRR